MPWLLRCKQPWDRGAGGVAHGEGGGGSWGPAQDWGWLQHQESHGGRVGVHEATRGPRTHGFRVTVKL